MKHFRQTIAAALLCVTLVTPAALAQAGNAGNDDRSQPGGPMPSGPMAPNAMMGPIGAPVRSAIELMTPQGREIIVAALREGQVDPAQRQATEQVRGEIVRLMAADSLDVAAMRRAMQRERELASQHQAGRHTAMLDALQKLSPADRKLFARGWERAAERGRQFGDRVRERMKSRDNR